MTNFSRRDVLKFSAAGVATLALSSFAMGAAKAKTPPLGLQLYSIGGECKKDFDGALAEVAKMGYEAVQFAGYHQYSQKPKELKKKLDDLGLKVAGTHIGAGSFLGDNIQKTIDFHSAIGCKELICPGDGRFTSKDKSKQFAEDFNKAAEILKKVGMACGYHNHTKEFSKDGDKTWWDLFAERTTKDVILELDVGWAFHAKQDPVALIKKHPGRTVITHLKSAATGEGTREIVGEDGRDWAAVNKACCDVGGTVWHVVEQERTPKGMTRMEACKLSLESFKKAIS